MPQGSNDPREAVQWNQQFVLLIDGSKRQEERAASLRQVGIVVHCASNGTSAAALWEPAKYQLLLVELSDAEDDVRPFCEKLMRTSPRQRVGIYCATAPFIRTPPRGSFTSATTTAVGPAPVALDPLQDALTAGQSPLVEPESVSDKRPASSTTSRPAAQQPISDRRQWAAAVARKKNGRNGLAQAAQEIAALHWRHPNNVAPVRPPTERTKPESNASIAARVLGGE